MGPKRRLSSQRSQILWVFLIQQRRLHTNRACSGAHLFAGLMVSGTLGFLRNLLSSIRKSQSTLQQQDFDNIEQK